MFAVLILSRIAGLVGILIAAAIVPDTTIRFSDMLWGAVAGFSRVVGLAFLYHALATTFAAVASPTAALVGAAAPVVAGALMGEQPGLLVGWIGIGIALPAVLLLTVEPRGGEGTEKALLLGVLAGSKVASVALASAVRLFSGGPLRLNRPSRVPAITAGVLDVGANILFLIASRIGLLAISGVVSSLYPAPTVILASILDRQKLSALRMAGLILALVGVALMTLQQGSLPP